MPAIVVASFNVRTSRGADGRNSWLLRRRATAAAMVGLEADVIGLQEVRRRPLGFLRRSLPGHDAVGAGRDDGERGEHCTVLFRRDRFALVHHETRWFAERFDVAGSCDWGNRPPRIVTIAVLRDRADGSTVAIANAHLDADRADLRERSATRLVQWLPELHDGDDWLVLGDLNATIDEPPLQVLLGAGFADALSMLPADGVDAATAHEFTGTHDGRRIDHVLVGPSWLVDDAEIVHTHRRARPASDHWPIRARVRRR